jgi:hypothetical protein
VARAAHSTTLDAILASGVWQKQHRILTCSLTWPSGDPPFATGGVAPTEAAIPESVPLYDAAAFDPDVWTDVSALVGDYSYNEDAGQPVGQLSLSVPLATGASTLQTVFSEMRCLVLQYRFVGGWNTAPTPDAPYDTGWFNVAWCLSDGYAESWEPFHAYTVNAKGPLKLATLDPITGGEEALCLQADVITHGTYAEKAPLVMVHDDTANGVWEFGYTGGTDADPVQPNWAESPLSEIWCTNVPDATADVPLATGGGAVQIVHGEGLVRINKAWAQSSPGDPPDYTAGLGFEGATVPTLTGIVYRYAHVAMDEQVTFRTPVALPADIATGKTQLGSTPGEVTVAGDLTSLLEGLTLLVQDGTARRLATTGLSYSAPNTTITLADSSADVATNAPVQYGDANRLQDVALQVFTRAGYHRDAAQAALYLATPEEPEIRGTGVPIMLPPQTWQETDEQTPLEWLEGLRSEGYVPPNYRAVETVAGGVALVNVGQVTGADMLPITHTAAPVSIDRSDLQVVTRVVSRGLRRLVDDHAPDCTPADVALPTPAVSLYGEHARTSVSAPDYQFALADLLKDRPVPGRTITRQVAPNGIGQTGWLTTTDENVRSMHAYEMRPWGWDARVTSTDDADSLRDQWRGAPLATFTWGSAITLYGLEMNVSNPWLAAFDAGNGLVAGDVAGWGDGDGGFDNGGPLGGRKDGVTPQRLRVEYLGADGAWHWLIADAKSSTSFPEVLSYPWDSFHDRVPVETTALRLVCLDPALTEQTDNASWYHCIIGVYLSRLKVFGSTEYRGEASLGVTSPFNSAAWQAVRARVRRRSWIMPEAAPWCSSQDAADGLALDWLESFTRDLAPRRLNAPRPDARVWDTVSVTLPNGAAEELLVSSVTHSSKDASCAIEATGYANPLGES